ncbi:hypothetical protein J2Z62_000680 [Mycoplasmoides fastidiosum]|uniref:Uncharacterized protein n=1 Tax=Mycoplasmoides fastidiosum TaxID=92758 RepID=A0ABU0LZV8_9BACT|nr:hypothetical protein [Mycoplasmoides fastidiosum]MDQ0514242.1 hypothetical protein [Mycoplasmoides fastidiosum]UUD37350.1 hypothetical protein NPA10_02075 [Mycoplasmoides fastidiosum]
MTEVDINTELENTNSSNDSNEALETLSVENEQPQMDPIIAESESTKTVFEYDDLSPSTNFYHIVQHQFNNNFKNDWLKFDGIKFKKFLELLSSQNLELAQFVINNFDRDKFIYLSKLHGVEAMDFVVNQYNLFHDDLVDKVIKPTEQLQAQNENYVNSDFVYETANFYQAKQLNQFKNKTVNYFLHQRINNQKQLNDLIYLLQNKPQINFVEAVDSAIKTPGISALGNKLEKPDFNNNQFRKRIVGRKMISNF